MFVTGFNFAHYAVNGASSFVQQLFPRRSRDLVTHQKNGVIRFLSYFRHVKCSWTTLKHACSRNNHAGRLESFPSVSPTFHPISRVHGVHEQFRISQELFVVHDYSACFACHAVQNDGILKMMSRKDASHLLRSSNSEGS